MEIRLMEMDVQKIAQLKVGTNAMELVEIVVIQIAEMEFQLDLNSVMMGERENATIIAWA